MRNRGNAFEGEEQYPYGGGQFHQKAIPRFKVQPPKQQYHRPGKKSGLRSKDGKKMVLSIQSTSDPNNQLAIPIRVVAEPRPDKRANEDSESERRKRKIIKLETASNEKVNACEKQLNGE